MAPKRDPLGWDGFRLGRHNVVSQRNVVNLEEGDVSFEMTQQNRKKRKAGSVALRETILLALDTLRVHKLRSFLTLLGVILAVFTLVGVMSIVEGLNRYVATNLANMGANAFVINQFGIITSHEEWIKAQRRPPIRVEDYEAVRDTATLVKQVAAADDRRTSVRSGNETLEDVVLYSTDRKSVV